MDFIGEVRAATARELVCYLDGASRDATFSRIHRTLRFSQKGEEWLQVLQLALERLGRRSWIYREGARDVWTLETCWAGSCAPATRGEGASFVRGYFDAEGGVPRSLDARFYVQFVQKNLEDLIRVRDHVNSLGISCGRLHNPSVTVDPDYWRFYVRSISHLEFCRSVRSWHPRKRPLLDAKLVRESRETARGGLDIDATS